MDPYDLQIMNTILIRENNRLQEILIEILRVYGMTMDIGFLQKIMDAIPERKP